MPEPFTIHIFVPDGDPEGVRIIELMHWTGKGIVFPRQKWPQVKSRGELAGRGVYILVGAGDEVDNTVDDDARNITLPRIYVGQSDIVNIRIDSHYQNRDFWDWGIIFVSTSAGFGRGHTAWIEYALIREARHANQCDLDNDQNAKEPALSESEKADAQRFLKEILQILPLVGLRVFEVGKTVATPRATVPSSESKEHLNEIDTIVVPARKEGFEEVFIGQDCWYPVRIAGGRLGKIKYIAAYQTHPTAAITHFAPVDRIELYGDSGKYKLIFAEKATTIGPIPFADAPTGFMEGHHYTSLTKLQTATKLTDLWPVQQSKGLDG